MRTRIPIMAALIATLAACRTPPKPAQLEWGQELTTINSGMFEQQHPPVVIKDSLARMRWDIKVVNVDPNGISGANETFRYLVDHSDKITVLADSTDKAIATIKQLSGAGSSAARYAIDIQTKPMSGVDLVFDRPGGA